MGQYTVRKGDHLQKIAKAHGIADWKLIYNHDDNAAFRELRPDPNFILPGDELFIPEEDLEFIELDTGKHHEVLVGVMSVNLRLSVSMPEGGGLLVDKPYVLEAGGVKFEGTVPADGVVVHDVPANAETASLRVTYADDADPLQLDLELGHVPPLDTVQGQQLRLRNLGYFLGEPSAGVDVRTRVAIARFQSKHELAATGEMNGETRDKLKEVHGS